MHESFNNYYSILGISQKASYNDIKKAYRKLSLDNHPDRNGNNKDKCEKFKEITQAYKILSDETERKKYDLFNTNNLVGLDSNIQNILNNLMSNINLDNVFFTSDGINMSNMPNMANMSNMATMANMSNMPTMANMATMANMSNMANMANMSNMSNMPTMANIAKMSNGFSQHEYKSKPVSISKTININLIQAYNGCKLPIDITRWIIESDIKYEETETIYVDIFKGIDNNEIITIENKGNIISSSNKGNIKIKVLINNDNIFERIGIDLIFKKSITLKESFCGFSFDLPYIDGREFKINNEAGNIIPANFKKIIPNMGMKREEDVGNLIIDFEVIYPKQLTTEQIKELEKIL